MLLIIKKMLIFVLLMMIPWMTSCETRLGARYDDDDDSLDLPYAELRFLVTEAFIRGGFSKDRDIIINEVVQAVKEKTNTNIRFVFSEETVYGHVVEVRIQSGLEVDLFLGLDSRQTDILSADLFHSTEYWVDKGVVLDLTDKITPDYPNLYDRFESYPVLRQLGTYRGRLYGIPSGIQPTERPYVLVRSSLLDDYAPERSLHTLQDLVDFMQRIRSEQTRTYAIKSHMNMYDLMHIVALENGYTLLPGSFVMDRSDPTYTPIPIEDTQILDVLIELMRPMVEEHFYMTVDTNTHIDTLLSVSDTALYLGKQMKYVQASAAGDYPDEFELIPLYPTYSFDVQTPHHVNVLIHHESPHITRILTILDWLGESNYVYDLLGYGIESKHYRYQNERFVFDEETVPAIGFAQRLFGYPHMEKNTINDAVPYKEHLENDMKKAVINPFSMLFHNDSDKLSIYLERTIKQRYFDIYGERSRIIAKYVNLAKQELSFTADDIRSDLSMIDNERVLKQLLELIEALQAEDEQNSFE